PRIVMDPVKKSPLVSEEKIPVPFYSYKGEESYVFVSYAHKDKETVYPEMIRLHDSGYRLWYDEGITPSEPWMLEIANAIEKCSFFLLFMSPNAVDSIYVPREIEYAINTRKKYLVVFLQETELTKDLAFALQQRQFLKKYILPFDTYWNRLINALPDNTSKTKSSPHVSLFK
nr:toll/interleukin-1 receptor domain-containing protein [Candidatus Sigynarchaeota archaeon]